MLELRMSNTVLERLLPVIQARSSEIDECMKNINRNDISFIYSAFSELLECRSFLKHCYVFAFYRYTHCYSSSSNTNRNIFHYSNNSKRESEKLSFETLLSELELLTEQMSDIVARTHLRATLYQIVFLTKATSDKRRQLSNFIITVNHTMKEESEAKRKKKLAKIQEQEKQGKKKSRNNWEESSEESEYSQDSDDGVQHHDMDEFWNHVRHHGDIRTITDAQELAMLLDRSALFTGAAGGHRFVVANNDNDNSDNDSDSDHEIVNRVRSSRHHSMRRRPPRHHHRHRYYHRYHPSTPSTNVPSRITTTAAPNTSVANTNNRVVFSRANNEADELDGDLMGAGGFRSMDTPHHVESDRGQQEDTNEEDNDQSNVITIENDEQEDIRRAIEESIRMQEQQQQRQELSDDDAEDNEDGENSWDCLRCTYRNMNAGRQHCAMCGTRR